MILDEAIKHAEEVAEENECLCNQIHPSLQWKNYGKCAEEHRQLAEWLKELKKLREQTRWIPVSEKLPEDSGNYLIAIADSNYTNGQYFKISWFYPSDKEWSYRNAAVIAWMPLPEPYKAEGSGEK